LLIPLGLAFASGCASNGLAADTDPLLINSDGSPLDVQATGIRITVEPGSRHHRHRGWDYSPFDFWWLMLYLGCLFVVIAFGTPPA
jgi:hypothetical protein